MSCPLFSCQNAPFLPPEYFAEHVDYNVNRKVMLGGGSNGQIYPVYLQSDRSKEIVVKEVSFYLKHVGHDQTVYTAVSDCFVAIGRVTGIIGGSTYPPPLPHPSRFRGPSE